ncbi:glycosyl hydrolase family 28-related protein [Actinopolymorpha singaporensis]|uniref:Pectate lyase superfamily protein n=1 Tax=Actinopolymorpha singaporensis TaxID=117157 RepID=A0A1H1LNU0_9ACTN|nr:glycosyl hydrolase family 28-related protein [Actinopolymorpha singaporensis]SDR76037.1 Pectate lyase superfamily protein [Actinopolymorpha singaporensis]
MNDDLVDRLLDWGRMALSRRGFIGLGAGATAALLDSREFGSVGDGSKDEHKALQTALDRAVAGPRPRPLLIPAGTYQLSKSLQATGPLEIRGDGPERTVLLAPPHSPAISVGTLSNGQPNGLVLRDFTIRSSSTTREPMLDIRQYGRKWIVDRVNFDAAFGDRTGVRVWSSWVGSIRDCSFYRFGVEGVRAERAAIVVKPQSLPTGNGPINNVAIADCAFERVQAGIDLHDPEETGKSTVIHAVEIRNPRFKNSSVKGPVANSIGIRANSTSTFNVVVTAPFFEDFAVGVSVRGWGWAITSPFAQSADTVVDLVTGGGHSITGLILDGAASNAIGTGVRCRSGVSGRCELRLWKSVHGRKYLTHPWVDDTKGKLVVIPA